MFLDTGFHCVRCAETAACVIASHEETTVSRRRKGFLQTLR